MEKGRLEKLLIVKKDLQEKHAEIKKKLEKIKERKQRLERQIEMTDLDLNKNYGDLLNVLNEKVSP